MAGSVQTLPQARWEQGCTGGIRRENLSPLPESGGDVKHHVYARCGESGKGLKKIVLPKHLHYLGENAFYGCSKLEQLTIRGDFMWKQSWLDNNPFYYTEKLAVIKNSNPNFVKLGESYNIKSFKVINKELKQYD